VNCRTTAAAWWTLCDWCVCDAVLSSSSVRYCSWLLAPHTMASQPLSARYWCQQCNCDQTNEFGLNTFSETRCLSGDLLICERDYSLKTFTFNYLPPPRRLFYPASASLSVCYVKTTDGIFTKI